MPRISLKYFKPSEFEKCVPSCSQDDCDDVALLRLDELRSYCRFPIKLNSAYRSKEYEKQKGRSGNGSHTRGLAFDIACTDSHKRCIILANAFTVGFHRVGIAKNFIHLDCDSSLSPAVCWLYD